jgi:ADP-dependent NAD(P)H-hydrate dehydratase / NAD(P)H-hydrate epimerase
VRVATGAEAAAADAAAIGAGTPSRALMQRAGAAVATEIALRYAAPLSRGALVLAGGGNNGGDGWVIARALHASGVAVRVIQVAEAQTPDAVAERALCRQLPQLQHQPWPAVYQGEGVVVDAVLGTGATGQPRDAVAEALQMVTVARSHGAVVVAVDLPSGLDAAAGGDAGAAADLTISLGTIKRGTLLARDRCGEIVCIDIGLPDSALPDDLPRLVDERLVARVLPRISASAHKGSRGKVVILGGAAGMSGAVLLAAEGALRSGAGMVRVVGHHDTLDAVRQVMPAVLTTPWDVDEESLAHAVADWADCLVLGPGLGRTPEAAALVELLLSRCQAPAVLDADAITVFAGGRADDLARQLGGRPAVLTPHPGELAALVGTSISAVEANRFDLPRDVAIAMGATVLLKGVPTVVADRGGTRLVVARGNAALATGGSGDVLAGMLGATLAQLPDALLAAASAAWVHGHAAERAVAATGSVRGVELTDVLAQLRTAWQVRDVHTRAPILATLPAHPA